MDSLKSFIGVNEEGIEPAAATGSVQTLECLPVEWDFVADHPFLFVVREDTTGLLLFIGKFIIPSQLIKASNHTINNRPRTNVSLLASF